MQHIEKKESLFLLYSSLLSWQLCVASSVAKMLKEVTIHQHIISYVLLFILLFWLLFISCRNE